MNFGAIAQASGLTDEERDNIERLVKVHERTLSKNQLRQEYYYGHQPLKNIGIAVPDAMAGLDVACSWAGKAVDTLAARSRFEGFGFGDAEVESDLDQMARDNDLAGKYERAVTTELMHCCTFAVLSRDPDIGAKVMFHSAETACGIWDGANDRIRCGLAVIETRPIGKSTEERPSQVNYYDSHVVLEITRADDSDEWEAERKPHAMGRPLMEPLVYKQSEMRPFGTSRITRHVRAIVDEYMRVQLRKAIASEVSTTTQKYIIGATEDDFDSAGWDTHIGHMLLLGRDEEGNTPTVGQFAASSIQPHLEQERSLAGQFASATSIPMSALIADYANPMSAEAVYASDENLVIEAQQLNRGNKRALENIAKMMMAIKRNVPFDGLTAGERSVYAKFANPAAPSIASQADAAIKINSAAQWYSSTRTFWEELGYEQDKIDHMLSEKRRLEGAAMVQAQAEQAAAQGSGGIDDSKNFYRITSIVKDFARGAMSEPVAMRMLQSLGISDEDARSLLGAQDSDPSTIEVPEEVADGTEGEL